MSKQILYLGLLAALTLSGCMKRERPALPPPEEKASPSSQEPSPQKAILNFEEWAASLDRA